MQDLDPTALVFICALFIVGALAGCAFMCAKLADRHPSDVRIVWYLFSLAVVCTCIAALWASAKGAIDPGGNFKGAWGGRLNALLHFMLDLETDLAVMAAILAILVVPQGMSYVLSGLFGCASAPIFVGRVVGFFVWSVVKTIVVAAAIVMTIVVFGLCAGWAMPLKGLLAMATYASLFLMISVSGLYAYRDASKPVVPNPTNAGKRLAQMLRRIHTFMTRKSVQ